MDTGRVSHISKGANAKDARELVFRCKVNNLQMDKITWCPTLYAVPNNLTVVFCHVKPQNYIANLMKRLYVEDVGVGRI